MANSSYEDETLSYLKLSAYSDTYSDPVALIAFAEQESNLHQDVFEADHRPYAKYHSHLWYR